MEELYVISKEDFEKFFKKESIVDKKKVYEKYKKHTNNNLEKLSHYYHTSLKLYKNN